MTEQEKRAHEYHAALSEPDSPQGSEFTEAEIEAQMDLVDRVDEMDEEGVFDLDARLVALAEAEVERIGPLEAEAEREAELDAFEWYKEFSQWKVRVQQATGQQPTTTFLEWLDDEGIYHES